MSYHSSTDSVNDSEGQVALLVQQLKQRDDKIAMMMNKTKDFVQKLKEDHALQLATSEDRCKKLAEECQILRDANKVGAT